MTPGCTKEACHFRDLAQEFARQLVARFADEVGSRSNLDHLLLVTCADLAAVGPDVLNSWKIEVLADLHHRTAKKLAADDPTLPPTQQRVYIRADKQVRYGDFMAVMNTLQGNGFYQVALINEEI